MLVNNSILKFSTMCKQMYSASKHTSLTIKIQNFLSCIKWFYTGALEQIIFSVCIRTPKNSRDFYILYIYLLSSYQTTKIFFIIIFLWTLGSYPVAPSNYSTRHTTREKSVCKTRCTVERALVCGEDCHVVTDYLSQPDLLFYPNSW